MTISIGIRFRNGLGSQLGGEMIMLRINHRTSVKNAKEYFDKVLARDYYGKDKPGLWYGKGVEILGLEADSQVDREQFHLLCENRHPLNGEKLNVRDPKRVYYDFTYSVPKSISFAYEYYKDPRILDAFEKATRLTLDEMEAIDMQTRVRKDGQSHDRPTGNMTAALFTEFTTRPVDGVPDMFLHQHAVIFNTTWDAEEERHKAGQFVRIKQNAPYYQARFESEVANELTKLGYGVRRTSKGWELNRVPDSVVEKFSRRTQEIEKLADDLTADLRWMKGYASFVG